MKRLILALLLGTTISLVGYNLSMQHFEVMTIVSVGYNDHSIYGHGHGFWEYWANNANTGNSYHGVSFKLVHKGDKVRINHE